MAESETPWKKLTIEQIATALGVSKTTVSRALSGKGRVGEETRTRVFAYVKDAGCDPSTLTRCSVRCTSHNLSLVIPSHFVQLDLPFLRKCMGGICRMATQRGYDILLCFADPSDMTQLQRQLEAKKVDGVILARTLISDPCLALVRTYGIPYAAMGRIEDEPEALQVDNDHVGAAWELTRLLVQKGLRRIAYLGGSDNYTVNIDRFRGYFQALEESGITPEPELICTGIEDDEQRLDALEAALERSPECILCSDDAVAVIVLKELQRRGLRVPEDIRLASLYDSEILLNSNPTITAVQFDAAALGAAVGRLLLDHMAGRVTANRQMQGYQVILRESTK